MKVHAIVGLMSGVIDDVRVFSEETKANQEEEKLCKSLDVPYDEGERRKYREWGNNDVLHFITELE